MNKDKREIKFRAWVKNDYPFPGEPYMATQGDPDIETLQSFMHHYSDEEILMQYTGLKDRNGKEIYEGDIVQRHSIIKEVKWFIGKSDCGWNIGKGYISIGGRNTIEIIGNIYENPDLIKNVEWIDMGNA